MFNLLHPVEGLALIGWNPVLFDLWAVWIRIKTSPDDHVNCRAAIPVRCAHHLKGKIIEKLRIFVKTSVADPDPKDSYNFARSGSEIFSTDPDPDMNLAHFPNPFPSPSSLTSVTPPQATLDPDPYHHKKEILIKSFRIRHTGQNDGHFDAHLLYSKLCSHKIYILYRAASQSCGQLD